MRQIHRERSNTSAPSRGSVKDLKLDSLSDDFSEESLPVTGSNKLKVLYTVGDVFGHVSVINNEDRGANVMALTWARMLFVPVEHWQSLRKKFPALEESLRQDVRESGLGHLLKDEAGNPSGSTSHATEDEETKEAPFDSPFVEKAQAQGLAQDPSQHEALTVALAKARALTQALEEALAQVQPPPQAEAPERVVEV